MKPKMFFSKNSKLSIMYLNDTFLPKKGYVWFVEFIPSQSWISSESETLTKDPIKALKFDTEIKALQYIIENKLGSNFKPTEHEFV